MEIKNITVSRVSDVWEIEFVHNCKSQRVILDSKGALFIHHYCVCGIDLLELLQKWNIDVSFNRINYVI